MCLFACIGAVWISRPSLNWPDRRPIGALFLADHTHMSEKNPRGWFNEPGLDVRGPEGIARFRLAILAYAEKKTSSSYRRTGAQGMIVWDLEGEELPHKITYVGDPRRPQRSSSGRSLAQPGEVFSDGFVRRGFRVTA